MSNQPRFEGGRVSLMGPIGVAGRTVSLLLDRCVLAFRDEAVCPFSCFRWGQNR